MKASSQTNQNNLASFPSRTSKIVKSKSPREILRQLITPPRKGGSFLYSYEGLAARTFIMEPKAVQRIKKNIMKTLRSDMQVRIMVVMTDSLL